MSRTKGSKNKIKDNGLIFKKNNTLLPILFNKKRGRPALKNWACPHCEEIMTKKEGIEHKRTFGGNCQLRKNKLKLLPGQQENSIAIDKPIISSKDNQCQFKADCEHNIEKHSINDTCFNPMYYLGALSGNCNLIVKRNYTNIKVKPEETLLRPADLKDIKKQIRELKKLKLTLASGCPERISIGRQIKELKKKIL